MSEIKIGALHGVMQQLRAVEGHLDRAREARDLVEVFEAFAEHAREVRDDALRADRDAANADPDYEANTIEGIMALTGISRHVVINARRYQTRRRIFTESGRGVVTDR